MEEKRYAGQKGHPGLGALIASTKTQSTSVKNLATKLNMTGGNAYSDTDGRKVRRTPTISKAKSTRPQGRMLFYLRRKGDGQDDARGRNSNRAVRL